MAREPVIRDDVEHAPDSAFFVARLAEIGDAVPVPSPCVNICKIDPYTSVCHGCRRTLDEVQSYATIYARQQEIEREALALMSEVVQNAAPLMVEDSPDHATPEDLRVMMLRSADTKMKLIALNQYVQGLEKNYAGLRQDKVSDANATSAASGIDLAPAASTPPSTAASGSDKH